MTALRWRAAVTGLLPLIAFDDVVAFCSSSSGFRYSLVLLIESFVLRKVRKSVGGSYKMIFFGILLVN